MFGRSRRQREEEAAPAEAGDLVPGENSGPRARPHGPWDVSDDVPEQNRIDFGSLQVPAGESLEVQVSVADGQAVWITVMHGGSGLQLQAFAAPKSTGLWDEVRQEIAAEVAKGGGRAGEVQGPFGVELRARIPSPEPAPGARPGALEPVRFLGVDGTRWFLRGVISGPAARSDELARPLERVFAGVVVNRGGHPVPPREQLEIQLPEHTQQALTEYMGEQDGSGWPAGHSGNGPQVAETR